MPKSISIRITAADVLTAAEGQGFRVSDTEAENWLGQQAFTQTPRFTVQLMPENATPEQTVTLRFEKHDDAISAHLHNTYGFRVS